MLLSCGRNDNNSVNCWRRSFRGTKPTFCLMLQRYVPRRKIVMWPRIIHFLQQSFISGSCTRKHLSVNLYSTLAQNVALLAGCFQACKDAEFMGNKHTNSRICGYVFMCCLFSGRGEGGEEGGKEGWVGGPPLWNPKYTTGVLMTLWLPVRF